MGVRRFDVHQVSVAPTLDAGVWKSRPCLVVSPDEMNAHLRTVIVAPMTTKGRDYPTRVACVFKGKRGRVVLDQIRTVDKSRLVRRLGRLGQGSAKSVLSVLVEMFAP